MIGTDVAQPRWQMWVDAPNDSKCSVAAATLGSAGLTPKAVLQQTEQESQVGLVLKQSPPSGHRVRKGSEVKLSVGVLASKTTSTPTTTTPTTTTPTTTSTTTPSPPAPGG